MARILKWMLVLITAVTIGCACVYADYQRFLHQPLAIDGQERILQIAPGSSARTIVKQLNREGIIDRDWMMRWLIYRSGLASRLKPGTVILTPDLTPADLPDVLAKIGKFTPRTVQILAGMNLYDIADRLQKQRIADKKSFLEMTRDPIRATQSGIPAQSFEGYLAAGAYTFEVGTSTEAVVDAMHKRWISQWHKIVEDNRGAYERSLSRLQSDHAIITLASIIEKEAVVDGEMPTISRVFMNRIRKDMMLQSDPTCVYPPMYSGEKPTPDRCKDADNAYSTYTHKGLPPGPIAMPSVSSLMAVLKPYQGPESTEILFFVAKNDGSGRHYFSRTYAEHRTAVDFFLKGKKSKPPHGTQQPQ